MDIISCNYLTNLVGQLDGQNAIGFSKQDPAIPDLFIVPKSSEDVLSVEEVSKKICMAAEYLFSQGREEAEEPLHRLCHTLASLDPSLFNGELLDCFEEIEKTLIGGLSNKVVHRIFRPGQACCSPIDVTKLILFHQQLLQTKTDEKELYSISAKFALKSIIEDLTRYRESSHPRLGTLIEDLKFAEVIRTDWEALVGLERDELLAATNVIAKKIYAQVQLLATGEVKSVIIAGGCSDHTVYFQIECKGNQYALTAFNTGFGSCDIKGKKLIGMRQYDQIPLIKFSKKFFRILIMHKFLEDMKKINEIVHKHFYCKELKNKSFVLEQKSQIGSSCVTKALMALLHYNLGKEEKLTLKTWLTEVKIEWLQTIESRLQPEFYQRELEYAQEALSRRNNKVQACLKN